MIVNGITVGSVGSTTNAALASVASNSLRTFDILIYLISGANIITVRASNGNFSCRTAYSCNPAGVVFGGTLAYAEERNESPVITMPATYTGVEGEPVDFSGISVTDAEGDALSYTLTFGDAVIPFLLPASISGSLVGTAGPGGVTLGASNPSYTYGDNGSYTVTLSVAETETTPALTATAQAAVVVTNKAPVVTRIALPVSPVAVGTSIIATADFGDAGWRDTHTAVFQWDWDAAAAMSVGATLACPTAPGAPLSCSVNAQSFSVVTNVASPGWLSAANSYATPGVYTVRVTVTDDDNAVGARVSTADNPPYVVVYDPAAGFVTGGGWITSPVGAFAAEPALTGKAHFGFVSRYTKGAQLPSGNTQFHFDAAGLVFASTSYQWLVVAGAKAQFKGVGSLNGVGGYEFLVTAVDAPSGDRFRIKIMNQGAGVVYDNQMGNSDDATATTALGGGSIVIHSK
ncbi:MAG: PKD domain-containing protein [Gemmatimonadaceae bacterium]